MIFASAMGILSAFVVLIVMARIGIRKFMGYPAIMDALVTVLLAWLLHGSYVGMVAAIIGGLVFSGLITLIRGFMGYERLTLKGWVQYEGKWSNQIKKETQCLNLNSSMAWPVCIVLVFGLLFAL